MSTHHIRLFAVAAVLLATPAFASPQHPTPAQLKAIDSYGDEFLTCRNKDASNTKAESRRFQKACDRSHALMRKLLKQGFCTYKYYNVGRPDKNGDCVDMPGH
jgi:hypothetical protein